MKLIALTGKNGQGKFAQVDDSDFDWLNQWKWYYANTGYPTRSVLTGYKDPTKVKNNKNGKNRIIKKVQMHRLILNLTDPKIEGDHRDLNRLNCQRYNLRKATQKQNRRNRGIQFNNTSGYKGVIKRKYGNGVNIYTTEINLTNEKIRFSSFKTPEESAVMYDLNAIKIFGEYANTNFPIENYENLDIDKEIKKIKNLLQEQNDNIKRLTRNHINNKTGAIGVTWDTNNQKWCAKIGYRGKQIWLGRHEDIEDAILARKKKEEELFGKIKRESDKL